MTRRFLVAILVLATAGLLSMLRRGHAQEFFTAASAVPHGAGSPNEANAALKEAVNSLLKSDLRLRKADLKVDADVTKNEITLSGTVESATVRDEAVELAKTAQVGVIVRNKITVKPGHTE
ncbi:MAG TPA: BON domain-containing protein [Verrucomicrobiae bacterium]|nr:BON domain-containing protein [Verrucomicrobiae bacterium]